MEPWSLASRCGSAALLSRTVCMRSVSNPVYQFSSVSGTAMALTLATTASMPPRRPAAASTQDVSAVPSRTSSCTPRTPRSPAGQFLLGGLDLAGVAGAELHRGALVGERLDDGPADAAGAARDQHAGVVQLQVHDRSPRSQSRDAARLRSSSCRPPYDDAGGRRDFRAFTTTL